MAYLGFRMEIITNLLARNLTKRFNTKFLDAQIGDLNREGKIVIEKREALLIAHGQKSSNKSGVANFSLLCEVVDGNEELTRLIQIMNVLGNDRLIKERISYFVSGKSMLNALPQLAPIKNAILKLDVMMPGFVKYGWYYAPEAIFDEE
jgi:hypothetical protein